MTTFGRATSIPAPQLNFVGVFNHWSVQFSTQINSLILMMILIVTQSLALPYFHPILLNSNLWGVIKL